MGVSVERLNELSPVLIPLIAHDRAGFGGGLFSVGLLLILMMRHAPITRSFVELIVLMGLAGFGAALGVHFAVGYTDVTHLAPAYLGCLLFAAGAAFLVRGLNGLSQPDVAMVTDLAGLGVAEKKKIEIPKGK
jgi:hypothetical protein